MKKDNYRMGNFLIVSSYDSDGKYDSYDKIEGVTGSFSVATRACREIRKVTSPEIKLLVVKVIGDF